MSEIVKIQVNLEDGIISIEAPQDALDMIFDRLESFLPKVNSMSIKKEEEPDKKDYNSKLEDKEQIENNKTELPSGNSKKKKRNTSGKSETLKMIDLGLDNSERSEFKQLYKEKRPQNQNQQVLVIMYLLKNIAKRENINKDEIYTGLKTVDERVPKRISSVLSNLMLDGKVLNTSDGKYNLHHTGEDFVTHDLPANKESSK